MSLLKQLIFSLLAKYHLSKDISYGEKGDILKRIILNQGPFTGLSVAPAPIVNLCTQFAILRFNLDINANNTLFSENQICCLDQAENEEY